MQLSTKQRVRVVVGTALASLACLVFADSASAQQLASQNAVIPLGARGFQITMSLQNYWQHREETAYAAPVPVAQPVTLEPRYVTIIGPDGRSRTFEIQGPITVVPVRTTVVHFGANNTEGPMVWVPARMVPHFGANR